MKLIVLKEMSSVEINVIRIDSASAEREITENYKQSRERHLRTMRTVESDFKVRDWIHWARIVHVNICYSSFEKLTLITPKLIKSNAQCAHKLWFLLEHFKIVVGHSFIQVSWFSVHFCYHLNIRSNENQKFVFNFHMSMMWITHALIWYFI